jgi:hypothetical protein
LALHLKQQQRLKLRQLLQTLNNCQCTLWAYAAAQQAEQPAAAGILESTLRCCYKVVV